jgi:hypothetical protein
MVCQKTERSLIHGVGFIDLTSFIAEVGEDRPSPDLDAAQGFGHASFDRSASYKG